MSVQVSIKNINLYVIYLCIIHFNKQKRKYLSEVSASVSFLSDTRKLFITVSFLNPYFKWMYEIIGVYF